MTTATAKETMTTKEVAKKLVEHCRAGNYDKAYGELYGKNVVSIEPKGANFPERVEGFDAVMKKAKDWEAMVEEVHGGNFGEPIVAANHFSLPMSMDITIKGAGRMKMDELGVYEVTDGKITKEQFFYPTQGK